MLLIQMKGWSSDFIIATLKKGEEANEEKGERERAEMGRWRQMYVKTRGLHSEPYQLQRSN